MFEQTFVDGTIKTHKTWTVVLSFMGQIGVAQTSIHVARGGILLCPRAQDFT